MTAGYSRDELLIAAVARLLEGEGNVAVGSSSPIPAAASLLAQATSNGATRALVFRNSIQDPFPESASELYDRIGQGRIDVFFLGGGQIDGEANLNMVGVGAYPRSRVRFPGCHGTPFIYMMVPRTILFREEHSLRVLVPKVDFISAPGTSPPQRPPPRGADGSDHRHRPFPLRSRAAALHPGERPSRGTVSARSLERTGFEFERADEVPETAAPSAGQLRLIRGRVAAEVAQTYPEFAASKLGYRAA